jgi:hypothetical protein
MASTFFANCYLRTQCRVHKSTHTLLKRANFIWKIYIVIESLSKYSKYRTDRTKGTEKLRQANKAYTHTHIVSYDKKALILIFLSVAFSLPIPNPQSNGGILEQSLGARNRVGIGLLYWPSRAGFLKQSMEARNQGLSYRPAMGYIGWRNRFLGSLKV